MKNVRQVAEDSLSTEQLQHVDSICQRFEAAWKQDQNPAIEIYVIEAKDGERKSLLRELLWLELQYRHEKAVESEYAFRFPEDAILIQSVFAEMRKAIPHQPQTLARETPSELQSTMSYLKDASSVNQHVQGQITAAPPTVDFLLSNPLAGHQRYRVVKLLGEGGMGSVYQAEHLAMKRQVALKVIKSAYTSNPSAVERFQREVHAAARLSHPNIITAYDAETVGDVHFLVMEYAPGITLALYVKDHGPMSINDACECIRQAALGLQHAHERGMVHRDVKPGNMMLTPNGIVKVLDFGLAALTADGEAGLTSANVLMGTPDFMAPEQAEDARSADIRADIYSLGCTLYFLLTGSAPFSPGTPMQILLAHRERTFPSVSKARPNAAGELVNILARMTAKNPTDRYQTPGEVAIDLERFIEPTKPPRKRRSLVALASAALFFAIVLAGIVVYRIQTDRGELVIATENDDVEVIVKQGGEQVQIIDTQTNKKITLHSGSYELELKSGEGLKLDIDKATLTRGKTVVAKIERLPKPPPQAVAMKTSTSPPGPSIEQAPNPLTQPIPKAREIRRFEPHKGSANRAVFSIDGKLVISCGEDNVIHVSDFNSGNKLFSLNGHTDEVLSLALHPDGKHLASGSRDKSIRIWNLVTGEQVRKLLNVSALCWGLSISQDGRKIVGDSEEGFRLWDFSSGELLATYREHPTNALAFLPSGVAVLAGGIDGVIRMWDLQKKIVTRSFKGHSAWVRAVCVSEDGTLAVSGCGDLVGEVKLPPDDDHSISLWDVNKGTEIFCFRGHNHTVGACAISRDKRWILSGSADKTIRLWNIALRKEVHRFDADSEINSVAFSLDGLYALSAVDNGTVRLWQLPISP